MIQIDQSLCIGCGLCVQDCISNYMKMEDGKPVPPSACLMCGHCVAICPQGAVSIPEYDMADVSPCAIQLDADALLNSIKSRRSIRDYQPKKIEKEKLEHIVQAGRYTATAKNMQGCRFVLVQDELDTFKDMIYQQMELAVQKDTLPEGIPLMTQQQYPRFLALRKQGIDFLFRNAPAVLFVAGDTPVDAALAAQNIELMAIAQGLGALYNGYLNRTINLAPELKQWLGLEDKESYVCMLLGYPAVNYVRTAPRKPADVVWK